MKIRVLVSLKKDMLDPQGKAVGHALASLGFKNIGEVGISRVIEIELASESGEEAREQGVKMAEALLANNVIEDYQVEIAG